ncbi:unnamed protein product [Fraxinus pennsylvanica]|uniref:Response regulatory domain-containing protein n=1 Tax=Fraxinus pennsylvanica TaxID=56036 RepID=A0AAD2A8G6_9LAMI|nr:unnamed protein product [Fraxinus pennsylvanica]
MGMAAEEVTQFHVLAVDDSLIDRKLIERLLKTSSFQVTTVDSGSKALEFLGWEEDDRNNPNETSVSPKNNQDVEVNLVITDYCMPGMTGYDLLKKMKESSSLRNIPVVIMSSENVPSRINQCLEEGAEEFLLKPVKKSDINKLKQHMIRSKCKDFEKPEKKEEKQEESATATSTATAEASENNQLQTAQSNNKWKAIDESLSVDRTRPQLSGLTLNLSESTERSIAECIWIGGSGMDLRSKARAQNFSITHTKPKKVSGVLHNGDMKN